MTKQEVFEKTRDLIAEHLGIEDKTKILPETNLSNEFGADSLDVVDVYHFRYLCLTMQRYEIYLYYQTFFLFFFV